jgi:hypothetical protein
MYWERFSFLRHGLFKQHDVCRSVMVRYCRAGHDMLTEHVSCGQACSRFQPRLKFLRLSD